MITLSHRTWAGLTALVALCLLLAPSTVLAHTELISSQPAAGSVLATPPERVRLSFSEPIEPDLFALEVYAEDRARVDRADARVPSDNVAALEASLIDLRPGTFTVAWRVLSIDGHVVRGTFAFTVGAAAGSAPQLDLPASGAPFELGATLRWWTFLLAFALVGGFGFVPLVLLPARRAAGIADAAVQLASERRFLWVAWPAVILLLLLSLGALVFQAADATGVPLGQVFSGRAITRLLTGTKYGALWLVRMALLLGLLGVTAVMAGASRPPRRVRWIGLALGAGLLLTIAASGHASAVPRRTPVAIAADWVHLLAGSVWVGGLLQLLLALYPALTLLDPVPRRLLIARLVRRFSLLAGVSVAVLITTGLYAGLLHVPSWRALSDTAYGAALSGKLILVVPLLMLGAVNLFVLHPRFVRAAGAKTGVRNDTGSLRVFRTIVLAEIGLAIVVLAVTAVLSGLPPATTVAGAGRPFSETQTAGDLRVTLAVTPNQAGSNRIAVELRGAQGQPISAEQVRVTLRHLDMAMGQREVGAKPAGPGQYQSSGNALSMGGRWQADVQVGAAGGASGIATFRFTTGEPASVGGPRFSPARILLNALTPGAALGPLALLLAMVVFVQRAGWKRARDRRYGLLMGAALTLVGTVASGITLAAAYRASLPNPIPSSAVSLARGQQMYGQNCASCHGLRGRGDGPAGVTLRPLPADFRLHMAAGHTDAQLYAWIAGGVDGTGMPAFGRQLASEDIWHLVNYIRTFAASERQSSAPTLPVEPAP